MKILLLNGSPRPNGNTAAAYIGAAKTGNYPANGYWLLNPANPSGYAKSVMTNATAADPNNSPWGIPYPELV